MALYNPPLCCDMCKKEIGQDGVITDDNLYYCPECLLEHDYDTEFLGTLRITYDVLLGVI